MDFFEYMKAIGTGPKLNRNLTKEETIEAIDAILEQKIDSEQTAAFLMLLRVKLESDEELAGCLESCEKYVKKEEIPESIELGFSYDGKTDQPYLFPLYSAILNDFFKEHKDIEPFKIVISGDKLQPEKIGLFVKELAQAIQLDESIKFFDRKDFFKELSELTELRKKLYMRTIFNTVEKLLNPANSKYAITSAFNKTYAEKYTELFGEKYENLFILKGSEGSTEVFSDFKYWIKQNDEIVEKTVELADFDINYTEKYENISLVENLKILENPGVELMKLVKLNVAIILFAANRVESIEKAYEMLNKKDCCIVRFWKWLLK